MNNPGLFIAGAFVTLLVAGALAALVWGAIMDGRVDRARRGDEAAEPPPELDRATAPGAGREPA